MPKYTLRDPCEYALHDDLSPRFCGRAASEQVGHQRLCKQHHRTQLSAIGQQIHERPEMRIWAAGATGLAAVEAECVAQAQQGRREWIALLESKARADLEAERQSIVYFVEREGFVKIGTTRTLDKRVKEIGRGSAMIPGMTIGPVALLATVQGGRREEKALHKRFRHLHVEGEWFLFDGEIREFVHSLSASRFQRAG